MKWESLLDGRAALYCADCLDALDAIPEESVDSVVTDPPYHLTSIVKRFGKTSLDGAGTNEERARAGADGMARLSRGFMGKVWDGGDVAFRVELWAKVAHVLKPGGHLVAFGGTRGYHRMACAIEDAGFEVRDSLMWVYGTGFPKSHNIGDGWGTALKPAFEPIVLARKPLSEGTVAANVLRWRTGALNIDACRIEAAGEAIAAHRGGGNRNVLGGEGGESLNGYQPGDSGKFLNTAGRWPANVVHDGSAKVVEAFPVTGGGGTPRPKTPNAGSTWAIGAERSSIPGGATYCDSGSAARFFYSAKASKADRAGSKHPTVKPVSLMRWLVRLVTPPDGVVLDPFAGTGTTGEAARREGMCAVLIEREAEYQADIRRRLSDGSAEDAA